MGEQKTQNKDSTNIDSNCDKLLMATWQIQLATRDLSPVVVLVDSWIHVLWILAKPQRARNLSSDWVAFNQRSPLFDLQVPHITALPVLFIHLCDWCAASTGYEVWSLPLSTSDANSHESIFKRSDIAPALDSELRMEIAYATIYLRLCQFENSIRRSDFYFELMRAE